VTQFFERMVTQLGVPFAILCGLAWGAYRVAKWAAADGGPVSRITDAHIKFVQTVEDSVRKQTDLLERFETALAKNTAAVEELIALHRRNGSSG